MGKTIVNFRVDEAELAGWKVLAGGLGMSLSDWIRSRCRGAVADSAPVETRRVYASEVPRAKARARQGLCEHRRRPDQYCKICD